MRGTKYVISHRTLTLRRDFALAMVAVSFFTAALLPCAFASGATYTWPGLSPSATNNWSDSQNWNGPVPVSAATTDIIFNAATRLSPNQDIANPFDVRSLTFNAPGFNLGGQAIAFRDGFIHQNSTSLTISEPLIINSNLTYDGTGPATITGGMSGAGALNKNGPGILTIGGVNFFDDANNININAGQIKLGFGQALFNSTIFINVDNGLDLNATAPFIGNLSGSGNLNAGPTNWSVGGNNASPPAYSGVLTGPASAVTKIGTGRLTLTGLGSSVHSLIAQEGTVALSGGSLTLTGTSPNPQIEVGLLVGRRRPGAMIVQASGVVNTVAGGLGGAYIEGTTTAPATITVTGAGSRWDANRISVGGVDGQGAVVVEAGGALNAVDIIVSKSDAASLLVQSGGTAVVTNLQLGQRIGINPASGTGTLTLRSNGSLTTSATRVWTDSSSINIDGGVLRTGQLFSDGAISSIQLHDPAGGTALIIDGPSGSTTYGGSLAGDGSIIKNGGSIQTLSGANTWTGKTTVNGGMLIMPTGGSSSYIANSGGTIVLGFGNFGFSSLRANPGGAIQYNFTNIIGGFFRGGGHDIRNITSFNGSTFGVDAAITQSNPLALNNVNNSGQFTSEGELVWDGGQNSAAGSLIVNASAAVSSFENTGSITITRRASLTNSGTSLVSGAGGRITIEGQGELILDETTLELNGSLLVNNGLIKGTTNVNFGALAKGAGEYGKVNVTDGGKFSPGNSPGTVTTGSTTWNSGGGYLVEIGSAQHDLWLIGGGLTLAASPQHPFTISLASLDDLLFDNTHDYTWPILHATSGIAGFDSDKLVLDVSGFKNDLGAGHFSLQSTPTDLSVHFSSVPEPGLIVAAGAIGVVFRRRKERQ